MSVEELGSLPAGWTRVRFGDVVESKNLTTKDPQKDGLDRIVGLTHLDSESLPVVRWDLLEGETSFSRTFQAGDVLFGKRRAYQRKVGVPDFAGICSGDILVFKSKSSTLLQEFVPYVVQSDAFFQHALGTSAGSLSPRTNWTQLARFEFALPPLEEQAQIVKVLDSIGAVGERYRDIRVMSRQVMESLIAEVVQDSSIAQRPLQEVAALHRGATPSTRRSDFWSGEIQWFTPSDLTSEPFGRVRTSARTITPMGLASCSARMVPPGSILLSTRATLGHPKIVDTECSFNQGVTGIICGPDILAPFLQALLSAMTPRLAAMGAGSTFPEIPKRSLEALVVPVPSMEQQRVLVERLHALALLEFRALDCSRLALATKSAVMSALGAAQ